MKQEISQRRMQSRLIRKLEALLLAARNSACVGLSLTAENATEATERRLELAGAELAEMLTAAIESGIVSDKAA